MAGVMTEGPTPSTRVADLTDGGARVVGRVSATAAEPLRAPMSGRLCVAFRLDVEEHTGARRGWPGQRGRHVAAWRRVLSWTAASGFELDDSSGRALVAASDATVLRLISFTEGGTRARPLTADTEARLLAVLERKTKRVPRRRGTAYRFSEAVLVAGESVAVEGVASLEPDPDGQRGLLPRVLARWVIRGAEGRPLSLTTLADSPAPDASADAGPAKADTEAED